MISNSRWMLQVKHLPSGLVEERRDGCYVERTKNKAMVNCIRMLQRRLAHPVPLPQPLVRTYNLIEETVTDHRTQQMEPLQVEPGGYYIYREAAEAMIRLDMSVITNEDENDR